MIWNMDTSDKSSLVEEITYDDESLELSVKVKYGKTYFHCGVRKTYFDAFSEVKSIGKYYLTIIKTKFMADKQSKKDLGVNNCSDKKRFIKQKIKLNLLNKDWFFISEKNDVYCDITLQLLPNGETDRYGNLGMITQDVPSSIVEKEKDLPKDEKTQGEILGNGFEFKPKNSSAELVSESKREDVQQIVDDLPF